MRGPLGITYGKAGYLPLPVVRAAWGDSPVRLVLGALLLAAASVAWLVVL